MSVGRASSCGTERCVTCGDIADEMTVLAVDEDRQLALCQAPDGTRTTVETALVAPVRPADRLLVHAGAAIAFTSSPSA